MGDDSDTDPDAEDRITYQFQMERDEWRRWTATVPRHIPLSDRLRALIRTDADAGAREIDSDDRRMIELLGSRIAQRAANARDGLDAEEYDRVAAELDKLAQIGEQLDG
jgi:hypothetical protein